MPLSKRIFDIIISVTALLILWPVIAVASGLVWFGDRRNPFYLPLRVGYLGKHFRLFKIRTMVVDADKSQMDTTTSDDPRIIRFGLFFRKTKFDELPQFFNILRGDLSLVGPRPAAIRSVALYTAVEHRISSVKPGITDISSIVFSNLDEIMVGSKDANLAYHQLIRPWKSRFALFYIDHQSMAFDIELLFLTAISLVSKSLALAGVVKSLQKRGASQDLIEVASRKKPLQRHPPPGSVEVVTALDKVYTK